MGNRTQGAARRGALTAVLVVAGLVSAAGGAAAAGPVLPPGPPPVAVAGAGGASATAGAAGGRGGVVPVPVPVPVPVAGVRVGSREVFRGDFDTGDLRQWATCQWRGYNGPCREWPARGRYQAQVLDGGPGHRTAVRVEVRDGDVPPFGGGERAEVRAGDSSGADVHEGDERWYELSLRFDRAFRNPTGSFFVGMQWHAGDGPPPLALEVSRGGVLQFANNRTGGRTDIAPIRRGVWVDYVLHVRFSNGPGAFAEAWVDGVRTGAVHRAPNMASGRSYLKTGIYRDARETSTAVVWQDGLRVTAP